MAVCPNCSDFHANIESGMTWRCFFGYDVGYDVGTVLGGPILGHMLEVLGGVILDSGGALYDVSMT